MHEIEEEIEKFYEKVDKDRADYFNGCLLAIDDKPTREDEKYNWAEDRLCSLLIWCDLENLPPFVAFALYKSGIDIEEILFGLYEEQIASDREYDDDRFEEEEAYKGLQYQTANH